MYGSGHSWNVGCDGRSNSIMELKITIIDPDEISLFEEIALKNNLSMVDYATNIVSGWIKGQLRGRYLKHIQELEPEKIKVLLGKNYKTLDREAAELKKVK